MRPKSFQGELVISCFLQVYDPFEIRQSTIYYAWSLGRWDKRIVKQASDVPNNIPFYDFLQNSLQKSVQFIFLFFYEI